MLMVKTYVKGFPDPAWEAVATDDADVTRVKAEAERRVRAFPVFDKGEIRHEVVSAPVLPIPVGTPLREQVNRIVVETVRCFGGSRARAAASLGVSVETVNRRLGANRGKGRVA